MRNNKKVIVFGGSGFLGGFVANELKNKDYDVTIADISQTKYPRDNNFVKCDILNYDEMINNLSKDYDIIYNFAAFSNLDKASTNPVPTINLNIIGNLNILEYARSINCKHYVFASSAYATSNKGSFYGISKLSAEILAYEVLALSKWYNESYDKILPFIVDGKLTINNDMLKRLNYTRPSNNKLGITINTPTKDLQKELVD